MAHTRIGCDCTSCRRRRLSYNRNVVSSYIRTRSIIARLDFNSRHVGLVHAQGTRPERVGTQERFREEVGYVALSADEFDTDLAAFGVVTMFKESNVECLFSPEVSGLLEVKMLSSCCHRAATEE